MKRLHDESAVSTARSDDDIKRARYDGHTVRSHNFDGENIAPVPSLLDANINTLKKYVHRTFHPPTNPPFALAGNTWASSNSST